MKLGDLVPLSEEEREILRSLRLATATSAAVAQAVQEDRISRELALDRLALAHEYRCEVVSKLDPKHRWRPALDAFIAERTQALRDLTRAMVPLH